MLKRRSMCRALTRTRVILLVVACAISGQSALAFERPDVLWQIGGHAGGISGVRFSPDGERLVTSSQDGTVKVWDVASGLLELTVTMPYSFGSPSFPFYDASFNLDGSEIWAAGIGGGFGWNPSNGQFAGSLCCMESGGQVLFSPDGQWVALAGSPAGTEDTTFVFRLSDGELVHRFEPAGAIAAVFSADSQFIITGTSANFVHPDGVIRYFRLSDGEMQNQFIAHSDAIYWLSLSLDGNVLASFSGDQTVKLWDALSGELLHTLLGHESLVYRGDFSPDGSKVASSSADGTVRIWDVASGTLIDTFTPTTAQLGALDWSPDGRLLAVSGGSPITFLTDPQLFVLDAESGAIVQRLSRIRSSVNDVSITTDDRRIAIAAYNDSKIVATSDGSGLVDLPSQNFDYQIEFTADGERVCAGDFAGVVRFFDSDSGNFSQSFQAQQNTIIGTAFSPDGQMMATQGFGEDGKLWNYPALTLRAALDGELAARPTVFSLDSQQVMSSVGHGVEVRRTSDGQFVRFLAGHQATVLDIALASDGVHLLTGSADETAKLWNKDTGAVIRTFEGHDFDVTAVAISNDGHYVATGSSYIDRHVRFWNAHTGELLHVFDVDVGTGASRIAFSKDDRRLFIARLDGVVLAIRNPEAPAPGDLDAEGHVSLTDFGQFHSCLSGPIDTFATPAHPCYLTDLDFDYDADLQDFVLFSNEFTGDGD